MSIEVRDITYVYGKGTPNESIALDGVSFDIKDGEFLGIIGHTGSGKSTLLQHLNGLLKPQEGHVIIDGMDLGKIWQGKHKDKADLVEIRKKIGLVFQYPEYQLFEENVAKEVAFGPKNLGLTEEECDQRAREAISLVGMDYEEIKGKSPFEFSGGQKRKIAIAGVIAMKPEVLILDEPAAGLDPKAHAEIMEMVTSLHGAVSKITVLVTHNMNDVATMADKILVMDGGRAAMLGTPKEIFSREKELKTMGLALPETAELAVKLKARGLDIAEDIFTRDELAHAIVSSLGKKRGETHD